MEQELKATAAARVAMAENNLGEGFMVVLVSPILPTFAEESTRKARKFCNAADRTKNPFHHNPWRYAPRTYERGNNGATHIVWV
jgi:hypothetical protein